jgi:ribonuclease HI
MPWERRRYRKNKVWIQVTEAGDPVLDGRGLAALRYKVDDDRTYSVRPSEVHPLDAPEPRVPDPAAAPPTSTSEPAAPVAPPGPPEGAIVIHTDGASSGNPGPAGLGVVLVWQDRRREISEPLGETTNNVAELSAILEGLRAVKRPELPVRLHTDSAYAIGVLVEGHRVRKNVELVREIRREMARFDDLVLVKVPAHSGVPENERADRLARSAQRRRPDQGL